MAIEKQLINGRSYDFTQIRATILGVVLPSIAEVNYVTTQEKVNHYGAGVNPVSRGHSVKEPETSIVLSMNDSEALRDVAEDGDLLNLPTFDITVTFLHPTQAKVVTHVLKNAEFTDDGVEAAQGDTDIARTYALMISHVKYR